MRCNRIYLCEAFVLAFVLLASVAGIFPSTHPPPWSKSTNPSIFDHCSFSVWSPFASSPAPRFAALGSSFLAAAENSLPTSTPSHLHTNSTQISESAPKSHRTPELPQLSAREAPLRHKRWGATFEILHQRVGLLLSFSNTLINCD